MRITNLNLLERNNNQSYVARALFDVIFENYFLVKGFKILEGDNGILFIMPPSKAKKDGTYVDIVSFLLPEVKKELENMAIHYFQEAIR